MAGICIETFGNMSRYHRKLFMVEIDQAYCELSHG